MILGANARTTLTGIGAAIFSLLTILAALPYEAGGVADIFPVAWKAKILMASAGAALILKVWNSIAQKDRRVVGGSVQQDLTGATVPEHKAELVETTKLATPLENR